MTNLDEYLVQKREALLRRRAEISAGELGVTQLVARASAEGRSGIRRIRIRDFQIVSDSPASFAGYDLGPGSPEILLGALASCLTHTWLIHAADQQVSIAELGAEVYGQLDARAGTPGHEAVPVYPHRISYQVTVVSSASTEAIAAVDAAVRHLCPVLNLIARATELSGEIIHKFPTAAASAA